MTGGGALGDDEAGNGCLLLAWCVDVAGCLDGNVHAWSTSLQAFCTQGVICWGSSGFEQWQAKSVREEHPSLVKALRKQLVEQEGMSGS